MRFYEFMITSGVILALSAPMTHCKDSEAALAEEVRQKSGDAMAKVRTQKLYAEIQLALEAFNNDVGRYPTESEGLSGLVEKPKAAKNWNGPYLNVSALKDGWGRPWIYKTKDDTPVIQSRGSSGSEAFDPLAEDLK